MTYEGMLEKLESSDGGNLLWKKVRLVLSDSFLRVFAAGATNAEMDHPDEQLGVVQLERAEFSPADSARFWGEKKTVWSAFPNRSMIEIRFNGTTALLAAETAEERNKWLLTLYQVAACPSCAQAPPQAKCCSSCARCLCLFDDCVHHLSCLPSIPLTVQPFSPVRIERFSAAGSSSAARVPSDALMSPTLLRGRRRGG